MFYDNIIKNVSEKIFIPKSFYSINKNLRNFKIYQMNAPVVDPSMGEVFGLDLEKQSYNLILDEFNRNITKIVTNELFDTNRFEWVDLRTIQSTHEASNKIIESIIYHGKGFKNIITNVKIANCLQDSSYFHISAYKSNVLRSNGSELSEIGSICGIKIWIDPYMKYDDDRMVMFNDFYINIEDVRGFIVDEASFRPRIRLEHKMDFRVSDTKLMYVIESESSPGWLTIKQLNRDLKINQILDEEE